MYPFIRFVILGHELVISTYNLAAGIGIIAAVILFERQIAARCADRRERDNIYYAGVIGLLAVFPCAYIFDALVHGRGIFDFFFILRDTGRIQGFALVGGLAGGVAAAGIFLVFRRVNFFKALNIGAPSIALGPAFGRIGCFLAGCCYGKVFKMGGRLYQVPTQLMESAFLFFLCWLLLARVRFRNRFAVLLAGYGAWRFVIEFLRGDDRGRLFIDWLSPSQFVSIIMLAVGVVMLIASGFFSNGRENI